MKIKCGIIGLPNVGKSTLFKLLTDISVRIANFPFCTIDPNIAIINIPDVRLHQLNSIVNTRKIVNETIEFIDVAGLIKGAIRGDGLGAKILNIIQTTKILCHVVRCFNDSSIIHIENHINPYRDIEIVNTEFILFDIEQCEKKILFFKKNDKILNAYLKQKLLILKKCLTYLYKGIPLRKMQYSQVEKKIIQEFNFLTFKPVIYIANVDIQNVNNVYSQELINTLTLQKNIPILVYCLKLHIDLEKCILHSIINNILSLLELNIFFTVNVNMIRAWSITYGTIALEAAYNVHSDFKKGFIRAQVIKFDDFVKYKGEIKSKKEGKVYYVGKNYCVEDGDVLKFLFNI